jgi:glycosyltransferase involved in cell wall biosynthesis
MTGARVAIDASNLRRGGGVTHLCQLLRAADPKAHGFTQVVVWGGRQTLSQLPMDRSWLIASHDPLLDGPLPNRLWWQKVKMPRLVKQEADILFVPGGSYAGEFTPFVTMFRNMLPFEPTERSRYGLSWERLRLQILKEFQSSTFRRAAGVIFLSAYAQSHIWRSIKSLDGKSAIIPHGIAPEFFRSPRPQQPMESYSMTKPFRLLYVSTIDLYKHQWHVVEAVGQLHRSGMPIALSLVGSALPRALRRLQSAMARVDPQGQFITYQGSVPYGELPALYHAADGFVFASSCENFPNILLEAKAAGLPVACSNRGPMPEILDDAGVLFDPEQPNAIAFALRDLLDSVSKRQDSAAKGFAQAQEYSWQRCAASTFSFLAKTL